MILSRIRAIYFSATGKTEQVVKNLAEQLSAYLHIPVDKTDFTLPKNRKANVLVHRDELAVFGVPTYAGRVPNKVLPFVQSMFRGENSPTIAVVTFGNRNFDSSLTELRDELASNGFQVFAAGAFVCEHAFSDKIGHGRPDEDDRKVMRSFAKQCADKLNQERNPKELSVPVIRRNEPVRPYYTPLGLDGKPAAFLKAKPVTEIGLCDHCGICAAVCPMGSIDKEDVVKVRGICIKCQACVRKCPKKAKYFDDPAFLSHVGMLEQNYTTRAEAECYL